MDVLISAVDLARRLLSGRPTRVLDVRWKVARPHGRADYLAGHIPTAVFVDLDADLSDHSVTGHGRHPLPTATHLQERVRRWGINTGDTVVVYDDWSGQAASRAWWLLRAAGLNDVFILDGGWSAWERSGHPSEQHEPDPPAGDIQIQSLDHLPVVDGDTVAAAAATGHGSVFDARAAARYRGDEEPLDPRAGHIPGAVCAPTSENVTADGGFKAAGVLRRRFEELHASGPITVYCGSGVTATHEIAALAIAGFDAALYPGSWSEWSSQQERPIATGPHPFEPSH